MTHLIDATINNGPALFAGVTLLLTFGCLAVAAHRSPVHRQRLAELAIAATLIWAILAVTPLPRPLAHGFFAQLSSSMRPKTPAQAAPDPQRDASSEPTSAPVAPAIRFDLAPALLAPADEDGVVMEEESLSDSLALKDEAINPKSTAWTLVPSVGAAIDESVDRTVSLNSQRPEVQPAAQSETPAEALPARFLSRCGSFLQTNWKHLLVGAYALGFVLCAAWIALGRTLLATILWTSEWPETWLEDMFAELCDECDTLRVWLVVSNRYARAMSFGIFRPTIVLPAAQCVPENAELLRHVLRHELVHIGRRDAWGTLLFNVSFLFLFFHPAFWWLRSRARLSAELVADEWAATRSSRDEYARELIAFVRATRRASFLPAGATGVWGSTTPFSRRIEMLIRRERPLVMHSSPAWRIASCTVLGGLIIAMAASLGRTAPPEDEKTEKAAPPATVTVTVDDEDDKPAAIDKLNISSSDTVVDDDDNVIIKLKDDEEEDDDAPKTGDKQRQKMQKQYERLARQSARLQKQMAELQKALEVSKAGTEHKSAPSGKRHVKVLPDGEDMDLKKVMKFDVIVSDNDDAKAKTKAKASAGRHSHTIIMNDGKVIESDGKPGDADSKGVLKFEVDGEHYVIAMPDEKSEKGSSDAKGDQKKAKAKALALAIKAKKLEKGDKDGDEETTIELKTDKGEMVLEVGPDHKMRVKKMKGFGKSPAEIEQLKKSLESLKSLDKSGAGFPNPELFKHLGELKALEQLKDLGDLKELEQLKDLEQLKGLEGLKGLEQLRLDQLKALGQIKVLIESDDEEGAGHGARHDHGAGSSSHSEKHGNKKHKAEIKSDKEETEEQGFKFEFPPGTFDVDATQAQVHRAQLEAAHQAQMQAHQSQMQAHQSQMQAHQSQMQALRAQIEAQRKVLEKLQQKAERMRKESSTSNDGSPSASATSSKEAAKERHVIVRTEQPSPAVRRQIEKTVRQQVVSELGATVPLAIEKERASSVSRKTLAAPSKAATDKSTAEGRAAPAPGSITDPMRLAELASNAIGELDEVRSAIEANGPPDLQARVAAQIRLRSAERKVRLLGRIAQSLRTLTSAQAQRNHSNRDQDEADAKLQILDLIISDLNSALGKPAASIVPATPAAPVKFVAPTAPVAPVKSVAPAAPIAAVAAVSQVAPVKPAAPVASVVPVASVTPAPAPAAHAAPATPATAPKKPAAQSPSKSRAVGPQSNLTRDFSFWVGLTR